MVRHDQGVTPHGVGIREEQLHSATGLRIANINATISSSIGGICPKVQIGKEGGSAGLAMTEFGGPTWLGVQYSGMRAFLEALGGTWYGYLPVPMTPTIHLLSYCLDVAILAGTGTGTATQYVRFRVQGFDQFGSFIEEVTPEIQLTMQGLQVGSPAKVDFFHQIHLSKVFSYVSDVQYMNYGSSNGATGHMAAAAGLSSWFWMGWMTSVDPTTLYGTIARALLTPDTSLGAFYLTGTRPYGIGNWGIGSPLRLSPYGPSSPYASPEILGAVGTLLREKTTPTVLNTTARLPARGQNIAGSAPTAGIAVGRSASGWQGCAHKLGFFSDDSWATNKISGINLSGCSTRASTIPTTLAQLGEDELQITAMLRTSIGTRRSSNPTSIYSRG